MRQLAQYQDGRLEIQDVPNPTPPPGGILVRTVHSVISPGTEKMKVEQARMSLLAKARARPDQVKKVLESARTLGWKAAVEKVRNRLESPTPLGYSAAGVVVAVDEENTRFQVGDRVACGGAECAHHAELIAVPDLLAARAPEGVPLDHAAFTTLCSISMHAVRQSGAQVGDQVMVVGQGLVGQLATAILAAAGARVLAVDLARSRLETATRMGAEKTCLPGDCRPEDLAREWTDGRGVDAVLLCIGGNSPSPAAQAAACLRDRGTLVIVGIYDAQLDWKPFYLKEIQVRYSRSYGPGRYDPNYEWFGRDYPPGHVRWTENRNFDACLALMHSGKLDLRPVISRHARFEDAIPVYNSLLTDDGNAIGVVLDYDQPAAAAEIPVSASVREPQTPGAVSSALIKPCPALDVIGAGNFVRTMLLPHLKGRIPLGAIVNNTPLSARHVREKFGFATAGADAGAALEEDSGHAVLIGTRHHLHAPLVLQALARNRHVFVEKPLCLTRAELAEIDSALAASSGSVMVGFNRRFAPATARMVEMIRQCQGPVSISCQVCAGALAPDHWYANLEESGGRVLGEACHFLDLFCHLAGAAPVSISAQATGRSAFPDSFAAQVSFANGSNAQLIYSAEGDHSFPKESIRVFGPGFVLECENFQRLAAHRGDRVKTSRFTSKGHAEEMLAWLSFLKGESPHPLPCAQSRQSMLLTFASLDSIRENRATHP